MRWAWPLNGGGTTPIAMSTRRFRDSPDQGCRHGGRPGRETPPPAAYISHFADDLGTGIGSPWNHRQVQDVGAGEGHDAADPGPCTISSLGEVSDEAYPHQTTEGPEGTPVA